MITIIIIIHPLSFRNVWTKSVELNTCILEDLWGPKWLLMARGLKYNNAGTTRCLCVVSNQDSLRWCFEVVCRTFKYGFWQLRIIEIYLQTWNESPWIQNTRTRQIYNLILKHTVKIQSKTHFKEDEKNKGNQRQHSNGT